MDTRRRRAAKSFLLVRWVCHLPYDIVARHLVVSDCWIGGQNQPQRPREWVVRQAGFLTVSLSVREISRLEGSGTELAAACYRLAARLWSATGSGRNLGQRQAKGNLLSRFRLGEFVGNRECRRLGQARSHHMNLDEPNVVLMDLGCLLLPEISRRMLAQVYFH